MFVVKRSGLQEKLSFDKITKRIGKLCYNLHTSVLPEMVCQKVIATLHNGVTTTEIDEQSMYIAAELVNVHPDYGILAGRLHIANLHCQLPKKFSDCSKRLAHYHDAKTGRSTPLISDEVLKLVKKHKEVLDAAIVHERDNMFSYFGLKTLEKSYLLKIDEQTAETPQFMYMRIALGIHGDNLADVLETYTLLSTGVISHASPTMFSAGTPNPHLASCFLLTLPDDGDSIDAIFQGLRKCALISKTAGGVGQSIHAVRASGAYIAGTNGISNGLVPMLKVFNATARYVDQGGNKRPGAFAVYLEPWHADIFDFLDLKLQTGTEELRARDLLYALWIPDLFMQRVLEDREWTLMCPKTCPGLNVVWGPEFEALYTRYEQEGRGRQTVSAQALFLRIVKNLKETGTPYILFKDHCNRKSNQQNLGTIQSSNLCVSGDTLILTEHGPQAIKELALPPHRTESGDANDAYTRTQQELSGVLARLATPNVSKAAKKDLQNHQTALQAKLTTLKPPVQHAVSVAEVPPVNVWNGQAWAAVVPKKTGEKKQLLRITTSFGSVLDCTPEHEFILAEIDPATQLPRRVPASALQMGTPLIRCGPIQYPGLEKYALAEDQAFRFGFVYGYCLQTKGTDVGCLGPRPPALKVNNVMVYKRSVTPEVLVRLNYNVDLAKQYFPDQDHELLACVLITEKEQSLQTRNQGPLATRKAWVQGFITALDGQLDNARSSYALLQRPWMMLRSVGVDARLVPTGKGGIWKLCRPWANNQLKHTDIPVVTGLQNLGEVDDTYCFTEPDQHAGVFNEQLTGQCAEIIQYSSPTEIAVCNLASIVLNKFVDPVTRQYNFPQLHAVTKQVTRNLNLVINRSLYALPEEMKLSNYRHRPMGIGVQGLADVFAMMGMPFDSPEAFLLNRQIFETMYHGALESSCELAQVHGPYATYAGSPISRGLLQYDLWGVTPTELWDWATLKAAIAQHGVYNSLLIALMPTASTAQILGNNECFEPFTSNIYTRSVLSGQFQVVNKYLIQDLLALGLWNADMLNVIIRNRGSVQTIERIPEKIRAIYKTVWEIPQRVLVDMAADRGAFVCQSQSFNVFMADPSDNQVVSMLMYGWQKGLKTGVYYLRTQPAVNAVQFTVDPTKPNEETPAMVCARNNPGACDMCSS